VESEPFGAALRRHRLAAGLSQERLAELARISIEAVGALERGTRKTPQRQTLQLLIDALRLTPAERDALAIAAVRPQQPRRRMPGIDQASASLLASPLSLTSFVGREADLATLSAMCDAARLVTIVGPGGVGKSRLALELARQFATRATRVVMVALGPLVAESPVLPAIAAAFSVHDDGSVALESRIASAAAEKPTLLVLDNCEHLLEQLAPAVHDLVQRSPGLRVVATSRERLGVDGERIYRLPPLSIGHAVDVFIDRATASGFDPENSADDLSTAAEICDRLDCIPLAIELAAACSSVLAFEAILTRLRQQTALPTASKRSALPQHRSMQAIVEWSYDRLDTTDALVFRSLAPFLGGCRLDDAQAVLTSAALTGDEVLYSLFRLHEQSLIDADRASMPRFQMLQTIRDFAKSTFIPDERTALDRRFSAHYFSVVTNQDRVLRSAGADDAIARIAAEWMNIRAALSYAMHDAALSENALRALGTLANYWLRTGTLTEGAQLLAEVDFTTYAPSLGLAAALSGAAFIELNRESLTTARAYATQARTVARAIGDPWYEIYAAIADHNVASASCAPPLPEPFEPLYQSSRELGDPWLIGSAACRMAMLAPDPATCNAHLEDALRNAKGSGDDFAIQAIDLALARSTAQADPGRALGYTLAVWTKLSPSHYSRQAHCIECFAEIAEVVGRVDDAAQLVGIALSVSRQSGSPDASRAWLKRFAQRLAPARAHLVADGERLPPADARARIDNVLASFAQPRAVE
jgi:predicted ATPase/transcriptional regulator with XRE-family HTH domain